MTGSSPAAVRAPSLDLVTATARERTILISGIAAGVCVFFAPLLILGLGLLAAYLAYFISDGQVPLFALARPLSQEDFRSVFAPAVNEAPLLVSTALLGGVMALVRRRLAKRSDPGLLSAGIRPFFPELLTVYAMLVVLSVGMAATHGGAPQLQRLIYAAPVYLPFLLCAAWLALSVWSYCFRSVLDLLASDADRTAATELRARARAIRTRR
ncbi:MAG TPA: hypothetical protein VFN74_09515 [Chloroflexota bacterium]|nr:hypothetical protein [Chloroflexota bacterium]